jgi:hypothetical protein
VRTTHFVEKSGDILGAGFLVGHKHATTTNTYLHARSSMAKSVLAMVAGDVPKGPHLAALKAGGDPAASAAAEPSASLSSGTYAPSESAIPAQYLRTQRSAGIPGKGDRGANAAKPF